MVQLLSGRVERQTFINLCLCPSSLTASYRLYLGIGGARTLMLFTLLNSEPRTDDRLDRHIRLQCSSALMKALFPVPRVKHRLWWTLNELKLLSRVSDLTVPWPMVERPICRMKLKTLPHRLPPRCLVTTPAVVVLFTFPTVESLKCILFPPPVENPRLDLPMLGLR